MVSSQSQALPRRNANIKKQLIPYKKKTAGRLFFSLRAIIFFPGSFYR
jgi:hypothetical protein